MPSKKDRRWEDQCLQLIADGLTRREIARRLGVSPNTIAARQRANPEFKSSVRNSDWIASNVVEHEDIDDMCAHPHCTRLGIWMTDRRAYCDCHWNQLRAQQEKSRAILTRANSSLAATA